MTYGTRPSTPEALAAIHAEAFDAPWSAAEIAGLVATGAVVAATEDGFVMVRAAAGEAEILTLAVRPKARRRGLGAFLVDCAIVETRVLGAETLFLEVAADNVAAIGLYRAAGFKQTGVRPRYYRRAGLQMQDALILALALNTA